jgi:hypothetical protein
VLSTDSFAVQQRRTGMKTGFLAAVLTAILAAPASAQAPEVPVDLELVLASDVSASIDAEEATLQRAGYLSALTSPEVIDTIARGVLGRIAVIYVEWAGSQRTIVGWTVIEDLASARAFAVALQSAPLSSGATTSISGALDYSASLFDGNGFEGTRRVIDISGDGRNYAGRPLGFARADVLAGGITINALPMLHLDTDGSVLNPGLDTYYSQRVVGGPGAFMVPALGANAFPEAILKKLIIEIAGLNTGALPRGPRLALAVHHIDAAGDDDRGAGERK